LSTQEKLAKVSQAVERILSLGGGKVRFIILYGSAADGTMRQDSDLDICVYYEDEEDASQFRLQLLEDLFDEDFDIKIFQQLPPILRKEVLRGKVLYCDDSRLLCDEAYETIKQYERFKRYYDDYIGLDPIN